MPGGPKVAYDLLEPIITKCAAQVDDGACTTYCGPIGAGNYVKMVHNVRSRSCSTSSSSSSRRRRRRRRRRSSSRSSI